MFHVMLLPKWEVRVGNPNRSLDDASFLVDASQRGFEGTDRISSSRLHGNMGAFYKHLLVWFDCRFLLRHCFCIRCNFPADCQHQWMNIRSTRDIHCSLERFSTGHNSCLFLHTIWRHYSVSVSVSPFRTLLHSFDWPGLTWSFWWTEQRLR